MQPRQTVLRCQTPQPRRFAGPAPATAAAPRRGHCPAGRAAQRGNAALLPAPPARRRPRQGVRLPGRAACTSAGRAGTGQVIPDGNMAYSQPGRRRTHWVSAPVSVCSVPHNSHPAPPGWASSSCTVCARSCGRTSSGPSPASARAGGFFRQGGAPGGETCRRWNHGSSLRVVINGAKPVAFTPARCRGKDSMPEKYRQRPYSY